MASFLVGGWVLPMSVSLDIIIAGSIAVGYGVHKITKRTIFKEHAKAPTNEDEKTSNN